MTTRWVVERPRPDSDVVLTAPSRNAASMVSVDGLDPTDYLTAAEATALARALDAAVDELAARRADI